MRLIRKFADDRRGATAIEYGLLMALVFLAMTAAVHTFADQVIGTWTSVSDKVNSAGVS